MKRQKLPKGLKRTSIETTPDGLRANYIIDADKLSSKDFNRIFEYLANHPINDSCLACGKVKPKLLIQYRCGKCLLTNKKVRVKVKQNRLKVPLDIPSQDL